MKPPAACASLKAAVVAADKAVWKEKILTPRRKAAEKKHRDAKKKLEACKKEFGAAGAVLYARALARAAGDAGVKFGLKPGFQKEAGPFRVADVVKKQFKVGKVVEAIPKAKAFAKKQGLEEAVKYAALVEGLNDAKKGATAGFITAQVGAAIVDVVGGVVSLGTYAAAAPFVHAAIGAGQKLTTDLINKDIALNEQKYKGEIEKYFAKKDISTQKRETAKADADMKKIEQMQKSLDEKTAAPAPASEPVAGATKPWYTSTGVLIGGGLLAGLAIYAATRNNPRA
jgi:hypothetical protein